MARGRKRKVDQKQEEKQEEKQMEEVVDQKQDEEEEKHDEEEEKLDEEEEKQDEEEEKLEEAEEKHDEDEEKHGEAEENQEDEDKAPPPKKAGRKGKRARVSKPVPKKSESKAKRARISKPEAEPEYFEDKRNLEDLWKEVFPVGTEWDQLESVYQYNWSFRNLEDAFEAEGVLHGRRVYLFGCTEPQLVPFKNEQKVICIPVVVAVVSPFPPSDKIGINSVQRETEEIVSMKRMKMGWAPYIPLENRESLVERLKSEIFILRCNQRRTALKHLKEDRVKKFEYCLPYFYNPLQEEEVEQSTVVDFFSPIEPNPVFCEFDWELDEVEEFTDKLIEEEELPADQKEEFMKILKDKVKEQKKANKEARDARKKAREELSVEKKDAIQNMRLYKFYPVASPDSPDVSNVKALFINRYYGKAHAIL